jgi:hypothetical protein
VHHPPDRGQALPLLVALLVLACALAVVVVDLGAAAVQRARARTAADAAALAGAAEGEHAARAVAADNDAELVSFRADGDVVEVLVRRGRATARATAEGASRSPTGVAPAVAAALARAEQLLGAPVRVVRVLDGGLTVAVDADVGDALAAVARDTGLCRQGGDAGPVHFAPCPPSSPG